MQRAAARAGVAIELGGLLAAGEQHVGEAVAVAVEGRDAAADHVLPLAGIDAVDAGARVSSTKLGIGDARLRPQLRRRDRRRQSAIAARRRMPSRMAYLHVFRRWHRRRCSAPARGRARSRRGSGCRHRAARCPPRSPPPRSSESCAASGRRADRCRRRRRSCRRRCWSEPSPRRPTACCGRSDIRETAAC